MEGGGAGVWFQNFGASSSTALLGPAWQQREDVAEICPGLDAVELTAGDQAGCDCVPLGAVIAAAESPVGTTHDLAAQLQFADVVAEANPTVVEKSRQRQSMVDEVV